MTPCESPPSIERWDSISRADRSQWDAMAADCVLYGYGWLRTLEECRVPVPQHLYFVARGPDGLQGAIVAELQESGQPGITVDDLLFNRTAPLARALRASVLPALVCGRHIGYASPILLRPGLPARTRDDVERRLLDAVDDAAAEHRWSVLFHDVPRRHSPLGRALAGRGYLRSSESPVACLPIAWDSFAGYLRHLRQSHPRTAGNIRSERNSARRHGLAVESMADPSAEAGALHALLEAHNLRLNRRPFPYRADLLCRIKQHLGDRALIRVARIDGRVGGVSVEVGGAATVHCLKVGIDPTIGRSAALFANLCYNVPIEDSTASGQKLIHYGRLLYEFKARRGCVLVDADIYLRCASGLRHRLLGPVFDLRSRRMDARTATLPRLPDTIKSPAEGA